jgi:hypothetical protein
MGRVCRSCEEYKSSEHFTPFKGGKNGLYPTCKVCRIPISKKQWEQKSYKKKMYDRAKTRATKKGYTFSIKLEDIPEIPATCPVLLTPMQVPSLDRIDSSKGYVAGNIRVISNRANMLKNNATIEELELVLKDLVAIGNVQDG